VHPAEHAVDADPGGRLGGAERRRVRAPGPLQLDRRGEPAELRRVAGDEDDTVLDDVRVDALPRRDADHLVHRGTHRPVQGQHPVPAGRAQVGLCRRGHLRGQPAAVAPGRAVAGELALQHHDPQLGCADFR
jgi:hypothetical protein